jgi:hypothetical protein
MHAIARNDYSLNKSHVPRRNYLVSGFDRLQYHASNIKRLVNASATNQPASTDEMGDSVQGTPVTGYKVG